MALFDGKTAMPIMITAQERGATLQSRSHVIGDSHPAHHGTAAVRGRSGAGCTENGASPLHETRRTEISGIFEGGAAPPGGIERQPNAGELRSPVGGVAERRRGGRWRVAARSAVRAEA